MSSTVAVEADENVCANCGIVAVDHVKLKKCACNLVKYCSVGCQKQHRPKHKRACKKRLSEIHDDKLFRQPDSSHLGECPICCLPLPLDPRKSMKRPCCSKTICNGCIHAHYMSNIYDEKRDIYDEEKARSCMYCRTLSTDDEEENRKRLMKRIKANDPIAMTHMGGKCANEGDYDGALKYFSKATELGDADAHARLGGLYWKGDGVEEDEEKAIYHSEKAAIAGHPKARLYLANVEERAGNSERSVKHLIIGANLGCVFAMKLLWKQYSWGDITKEDLDATLRTHQAALDEMKSPQREEADVFQSQLGR